MRYIFLVCVGDGPIFFGFGVGLCRLGAGPRRLLTGCVVWASEMNKAT